ncbi:MAG: CotH kinase family protein, partial [Herbinix sp.]|nr:CotH kinase family protein [Herbinix sp.]
YNPSNSSVFYLVSWDFDCIFNWMYEESDMPNIYDGLNNVVLHRRYLQKDGNIEKVKERIEELKNNEFSSDKVKSLIKQYKPILLEMMDQYPDNILSTISLNEQMAYLGKIDERILINYHEFLEQYDLK